MAIELHSVPLAIICPQDKTPRGADLVLTKGQGALLVIDAYLSPYIFRSLKHIIKVNPESIQKF